MEAFWGLVSMFQVKLVSLVGWGFFKFYFYCANC